MQTKDTVKLLRDCHLGLQMGVSSLGQVLPKVKSVEFKNLLENGLEEHERLLDETEKLLDLYREPLKDSNPILKGYAHVSTGVKMMVNHEDEKIADILSDGWHMGIKSLSKSLNHCKQAEENAVGLTNRLLRLEEDMASDTRLFL